MQGCLGSGEDCPKCSGSHWKVLGKGRGVSVCFGRIALAAVGTVNPTAGPEWKQEPPEAPASV